MFGVGEEPSVRVSFRVRGLALTLCWSILFGGWLHATDDEGFLSANRLENEGIAQWQSGDYEAGGRLIEQSIEVDPTNPQRLMNYGGLLMLRGQELLRQGQPDAAARTLEKSERRLAAGVRLAEGLPGQQAQAAQGFFLLGEIAFHARKDPERAGKFYRSAALRSPDDPRILSALEKTGGVPRDVSRPVAPPSPPRVVIGGVGSITLDEVTLRLASEQENETVRVREYLPTGETMEDWSTLFARREHRRHVEPYLYGSLLADQAARQGGKVIATSAGPGDSASVVFVMHSPAMQLSEVNTWLLFDERGELVSEQFARRIRGEDHREIAESLARGKSSGWIRQLQARHSARLAQAPVIAEIGESDADDSP